MSAYILSYYAYIGIDYEIVYFITNAIGTRSYFIVFELGMK